ncbi:MAG: hypothetical protein OEY24_03740 [Candidatus Bathyarchaeota archaeon]|nr:hypothetical protein [Candidatus Bathyarchaeota archaeon]MDH5494798.1 hypothetical protein [Candidatus Bathyarchaeota archaeon]
MSEIYKVPIPLINYLNLIERKRSPYYDLICYLVLDIEKNYKNRHPHNSIIYTINPRLLKKEVEDKIPSEKLTTINISRTVLALFYGSKLQKDEDYYITTSSGGRKNYHIKVNSSILSLLRMQL